MAPCSPQPHLPAPAYAAFHEREPGFVSARVSRLSRDGPTRASGYRLFSIRVYDALLHVYLFFEIILIKNFAHALRLLSIVYDFLKLAKVWWVSIIIIRHLDFHYFVQLSKIHYIIFIYILL